MRTSSARPSAHAATHRRPLFAPGRSGPSRPCSPHGPSEAGPGVSEPAPRRANNGMHVLVRVAQRRKHRADRPHGRLRPRPRPPAEAWVLAIFRNLSGLAGEFAGGGDQAAWAWGWALSWASMRWSR